VSDPAVPPAPNLRPLCVDLDGTILRGDTFWEQVFLLLRRNPFFAFQLVAWSVRGKPFVKERLAALPMPDWSTFHVDPEMVDWLRAERARGRVVHLVTGAHAAAARLASENLRCFDDVHCTTATENLTSLRKATLLVGQHGSGGFDYAGNSNADFAVWKQSATAIACHARPYTITRLRATHANVEVRAPLPRTWAVIWRQLRPYQWVKNLLVLLPLILAHRLDDAAAWCASALAFVAFCCVASSAYCLNDLFDLASDRQHPEKRRRPLPSGDLAPLAGVVLSLALPLAACLLALFLPLGFFAVLAIYGLGTLLYSISIKRLAGLDVILLTALYTLRIVAGGQAAQIYVSGWLLAFSIFFFLSLSLLKRHGEIIAANRLVDGYVPGRGYRPQSAAPVRLLGQASALISALVLIFYVNGETVTRLYRTPALLWLLAPLVLLWFQRMWKLSTKGRIPDDPIPFVFRDPVSYGVALLTGLLLVVATRTTW
jgi:4-hydroxybenzoate polyprenyltransferase